ncbi:MAG: citrate synthase [Vicinamibacteria bacterium]
MTTANPGLEGVVAADTRLSSVDGEKGELMVAGYLIEELAPNVSFEEMVHLLWHGRLPNHPEAVALQRQIGERRSIPGPVQDMIVAAARAGAPAMSVLRTAVSALGFKSTCDDLGILAAFPTIVAAWARAAKGAEPVAPDPALGHAADFLRMISGEAATTGQIRALETYLNTTADHGLNASTFVARSIISTHSDMAAAVTGAIGALQGPLHGGAPGPVLDLISDAAREEDKRAFLRSKVEDGERLMGFGHRIYRVRDPRADVLAKACETLRGAGDQMPLFDTAREVERLALEVLEEHKPGRALRTNVEFYTALLLHAVGIPKEIFTAVFATSRVAGWIAHAHEQLATKKLVRPQSNYVGPTVGDVPSLLRSA